MEERLREIAAELTSALNQVALLKKDRLLPSPGLLAAITALRIKQESFMDGLELWRGFAKHYPAYDPTRR
jgi:hypothetical protein